MTPSTWVTFLAPKQDEAEFFARRYPEGPLAQSASETSWASPALYIFPDILVFPFYQNGPLRPTYSILGLFEP